MRSYVKDDKKGKRGVKVFIKQVLKNKKYLLVEHNNKEDYDLISDGIKYEIKSSYKDDFTLVLEEDYDPKKNLKGWMYTSKCNYIAFVSLRTYDIIMYYFPLLQKWYMEHKDEYQLKSNYHKTKGEWKAIWRSTYRRIPMDHIDASPEIIRYDPPYVDII